MQVETSHGPPPIWGSQAIDPSGFNLPALKVKYLLAHLPERGRVLEVGSGDGKILRTLAAQRPALHVCGCDIREWTSPDPGIEFRVTTGRDIPYTDASFEAVLVVDVLEHVDDPAHLVSEIHRVLKPGGRFVGFVPIEGEPRSLYTLYRSLLGKDLYVRTKHHVQAFTRAGISQLIENHFRFVDVSHAYHVFGHVMDATFFAAAHLPRLAKFWWRENRYYAPEQDQTTKSPLVFALNRMLELGNAVAYLESRLLAKSQLAAAGMLFEAHKT
ncbi:MAG: class I SAM-dependent methyltransferase [Kofleriaceae bacterium]